MSNQNNGAETKAEKQLAAYLAEALGAAVSEIFLEYIPEGLQVMFMLGDTGAGRVLEDAQLARALMRLIVERAGLETKARGAMTWEIHGQPVEIAVEEYDSFGECSFRLKLKPASRKRPRP